MTGFDAKSSRTKRPCPIWVDAFQRDTQHLEADEIGAYFLILMAMWTRSSCDFPDDDHRLSRVARVSLRLWKSRVAVALRPFFHCEDGMLMSKRLREEAAYVERQVQSQSDRKTGEKSDRSLENNNQWQTADIPQNDQGLNRGTILPNNPTVIAAADAPAPAREPAVLEGFERPEHVDLACHIIAAVHRRWPDWLPPGDKDRVRQWLDGGFSRSTIEAAIEARIPRMTGPPRSFRYFEACVADLHQSLSRPIDSTDHRHDDRPDRELRGADALVAAFARRAAARGG